MQSLYLYILILVLTLSTAFGQGRPPGNSMAAPKTLGGITKVQPTDSLVWADSTYPNTPNPGVGLDSTVKHDERAPVKIQAKCRYPQYPELAKRSGAKAKIFTKAYIDPTGKVRRIAVFNSQPGQGEFVAEVVSVLKTYEFEPATMDGKPVGVWVVIPFDFKTTN